MKTTTRADAHKDETKTENVKEIIIAIIIQYEQKMHGEPI